MKKLIAKLILWALQVTESEITSGVEWHRDEKRQCKTYVLRIYDKDLISIKRSKLNQLNRLLFQINFLIGSSIMKKDEIEKIEQFKSMLSSSGVAVSKDEEPNIICFTGIIDYRVVRKFFNTYPNE